MVDDDSIWKIKAFVQEMWKNCNRAYQDYAVFSNTAHAMMTPSPIALITGAARRIGAGIARHLHAHGYALALHCYHSRAELQSLCDELEAIRPRSTLILQADLADAECLPDLVTAAVERFGRLDALVNNASSFYPTSLETATPAQWEALFASNTRAPFFLTQAAAPYLKVSGGGVVNLADIYADMPLRGYSIYSISKAALVMVTRALALELAPDVRVNAIAPGAILWPEHGTNIEREQRLISATPLARLGQVEEIAEAVHWLLTGARYTTGEVLRVDGGRGFGFG